jgi:hypothetical protein
MGIHRPVRIESRPAVHIRDVFVRPLCDEQAAEVRVEVFNCGERPRDVKLEVTIHGQNFECRPIDAVQDVPAADAGVNFFRIRVPLPDARLWSPDSPWLYRAHVVLRCGEALDAQSSQFGMRSFVLDESPGSDGMRGRFFLNGETIRLRGANTMGHEQQCVFKGDIDQLRDDILLAKLANMNFLRFTQRPVEPEVYDLVRPARDDGPKRSPALRLPAAETSSARPIRQAAEMERLDAQASQSSILVSLHQRAVPGGVGRQVPPASHPEGTRKLFHGGNSGHSCGKPRPSGQTDRWRLRASRSLACRTDIATPDGITATVSTSANCTGGIGCRHQAGLELCLRRIRCRGTRF